MRLLLFIVPLLLYVSCNEPDGEIDDVEERTRQAIAGLTDQMTEPTLGWKTVYKPTASSGGFFMLLDFDADGEVRVRTDVAANDGEFFDHVMNYRVDNSLRLELIFETYGIFHYLFELDQTSFGAEFEFFFEREENGNLVFSSKTDNPNDATIFTLELAAPSDSDLLTNQLPANLDKFKGLSPQIFGEVPPLQQVYLDNENMSFFWTLDLDKRIVEADFAGIGTSFQEIYDNGSGILLGYGSGFSLSGNRMLLQNPLIIPTTGGNLAITELTFNSFVEDGGGSLCPENVETTPTYAGVAGENGNFIASKTLFDRSGEDFTANDNGVYSVNIPFIFDDSLQSLSDEGVIRETIPNAVAFLMTYGFDSETLPAYGIGFITEDGDSTDIILREFEPTTSIGNQVNITFTNDFYQSDGIISSEDSTSMIEVTETIFSGGQVYAYDFPIQGLQVYRLFNPCNRFEIFVVQ